MGPGNLLKRYIRPAVKRAGIVGKTIGWHNFRHSLATNLRAMGVDVKVAQELLRHANVRTTLDIYTRAVSEQKREANAKVVEMMLPGVHKMLQHPRRSWRRLVSVCNYLVLNGLLVGLIGSIPNRAVFKPQYPAADLERFQLREPETECVALTKAVSGHHHHYTPLSIPIVGLTLRPAA